MEIHPLYQHDKWLFWKPSMSFRSAYVLRDLRTGGESAKDLYVNHFSCREGLIGAVHSPFVQFAAERKQKPRTYDVDVTKIGEILLNDSRVLGQGKTEFAIQSVHSPHMPGDGPEASKLLVEMADLVAGIPLLLLNPNRQPGGWWKTKKTYTPAHTVAGVLQEATFHWWGSDNSILFHPALLSIAFGLYRQAYFLVYAGMAEQVLASVPREEVEEVLTAADWRRALGIIEKARPWIQVPVGKHGEIGNYPFPWYQRATIKSASYWQRLIRLHRALRRHGQEAVFGPFFEGWNLSMAANGICTGAFHFWGKDKELTDAHKRLMELGKPLKRKASE